MPYEPFLEKQLSNSLLAKGVEFTTIKMMGGLCFMVDNKMCIGIIEDLLMARIGPDFYKDALEMDYVREMAYTGRAMNGFVFLEPEAYQSEENLNFWLDKCLEYNPIARSSKKKKSKKK